ncbi:hypothetical protein HN670_01000 [bacterium]|jgi:L-asparaginase/Glu-tRNA(Gln) amidotransferase subunit D|nr:hypothetical protein [bacterium]
MAKVKKKICLLLAGGTWTMDKAKHMLSVNQTDDIDAWLKTMPELSILSDLEIRLIYNEEEKLDFKSWENIASFIAKNHQKYDGFVLVTKSEQLVPATVTLNFLLQNLSTSIVVTGSQMAGLQTKEKKDAMQYLVAQQGGLGLRSNLINAVQVVCETLPQPAIMFGSRLIAGVKAQLEYQQGKYILASVDENYLAKIDFGITFKQDLQHSKKAIQIFKNINQDILILDDRLPFDLEIKCLDKYKAIFVNMHDEELSIKQKKYLQSLDKPVILYHINQIFTDNDFINLIGCTQDVALVKTMWAIANIAPNDLAKVLKSNIVDEFINV